MLNINTENIIIIMYIVPVQSQMYTYSSKCSDNWSCTKYFRVENFPNYGMCIIINILRYVYN